MLVPDTGSVWPVRVIDGSRAVHVQPENFGRNAFAFGDARSGVLFHLGAVQEGRSWQIATLYQRDGSYAGLPLAYGLCWQADGRPASGPSATAADGPVDTSSFDRARWREAECALVTVTGHRARFRFTVRDPEAIELASEDADVWNGAPVSVERHITRPLDGHSPGVAMLRTASGLDAIQMTFARFDPPSAVDLVQFRRLGGSGPMAGQPAFAICGHGFLVKRPSN